MMSDNFFFGLNELKKLCLKVFSINYKILENIGNNKFVFYFFKMNNLLK